MQDSKNEARAQLTRQYLQDARLVWGFWGTMITLYADLMLRLDCLLEVFERHGWTPEEQAEHDQLLQDHDALMERSNKYRALRYKGRRIDAGLRSYRYGRDFTKGVHDAAKLRPLPPDVWVPEHAERNFASADHALSWVKATYREARRMPQRKPLGGQ